MSIHRQLQAELTCYALDFVSCRLSFALNSITSSSQMFKLSQFWPNELMSKRATKICRSHHSGHLVLRPRVSVRNVLDESPSGFITSSLTESHMVYVMFANTLLDLTVLYFKNFSLAFKVPRSNFPSPTSF